MAERQAAREALACKIYQARIDRGLFFRHSLFNDAGWDALLAVYVYSSTGRTLTAGQLCRATPAASPTSALRMQRRLVDCGLVHRVPHPSDGRLVLIELTDEGRQLLEGYFDHLLDRHFTEAGMDMPQAVWRTA